MEINFDLTKLRSKDMGYGCKLIGLYEAYWFGVRQPDREILPNGDDLSVGNEWRYVSDQFIEEYKPTNYNDKHIRYRLADSIEVNPYTDSPYALDEMFTFYPNNLHRTSFKLVGPPESLPIIP